MKTTTTHKQAELLAYLKSYTEESGGIGPSFEEMMYGVGLKSKSGVHRLLTALEERGLISRKPGRSRCITILPENMFDGVPSFALLAELARRGEINMRKVA